MHSPLLGRGHLRNVALALTSRDRHRPARSVGARDHRVADAAAAADGSIRCRWPDGPRRYRRPSRQPCRNARCCRNVSASWTRRRICSSRPSRTGHQPSQRLALADLCHLHGVDPLIATAASDRVGPADTVTAEEVDVTRQSLVARGRRFVWHDALADAIAEALARTRRGDLIVLVGAQGMNGGKEMLSAEG